MKILPLKIVLVFFLPSLSYGQDSQEEILLLKAMCVEFQSTEHLSDSIRIENTYTKHLYPYLRQFDEKKIDSIGNSIYFRFQRECETFRKFLSRVDPLDNWEEETEMPESELTKKEIKEFEKIGNFYI